MGLVLHMSQDRIARTTVAYDPHGSSDVEMVKFETGRNA